jgi:Ca2+/Na+ antiporter
MLILYNVVLVTMLLLLNIVLATDVKVKHVVSVAMVILYNISIGYYGCII